MTKDNFYKLLFKKRVYITFEREKDFDSFIIITDKFYKRSWYPDVVKDNVKCNALTFDFGELRWASISYYENNGYLKYEYKGTYNNKSKKYR